MKKQHVVRSFRCLLVVLALAVGLGAASAVQAAEKGYPSRQVELVIPFPPGGSVDVLMRAINDELTKNFGVPTLLVNRAGGSSGVGTDYASRAKPDGYTLLVGNNMIFVTVPATQTDLPYKPSDFVPIARFGYTPNFFLVRKDAPWKTFEELMAYAKKNPGKLTCATSGVASIAQFCLELLKVEAGVEIRHVPFKGGPPANTATLGGHVDVLSSTLPTVLGLIKSGDLRPLVIFTDKRMPGYPDVPTIAEKGYPNSIMVLWTGLFAPKGVEKPILERISKAVEKTVTTPAIITKIRETGNEYEYIPADKFAQEIDSEHAKIVDLVKKAHLTFK